MTPSNDENDTQPTEPLGQNPGQARSSDDELDRTLPVEEEEGLEDSEVEQLLGAPESLPESTHMLEDLTEGLPPEEDPIDLPEGTIALPESEFESAVGETSATSNVSATSATRSEGSEWTGETIPVPDSEFVSKGGVASGETTLRRAPSEVISMEGGEERLIIAGRFEVLRSLGEGGMGKVYLVKDGQIEGREVAMKLLRSRFSANSQFRTMFFQEIRAAQNFVSEHVVQVRDCGQMEDGKLFLTMDYIPGEDLSHLLKRERQLAVRHALEITRQILLGLHSGHEQGFIHRDVKPGNVILASQVPKSEENPMGVGVRLLDFGIAGLVEEMGEGIHAGTPSFMSPEQVKGQRLDPRSDLFAVGIVLYQMVTGSRPFTGKTKKEITNSIIETNLTPLIHELTDVPKPVRKLLARALSKNRDKRFQSALEFADAITDSKSYKLGGEVSPLAKVALGAFTVLAVMEGGLLWKLEKELRGKDAQLQQGIMDVNEYQDKLGAAQDEINMYLATIDNLETKSESTEGIGAVESASLSRALGEKDDRITELTDAALLHEQERLQREQQMADLQGEISDMRDLMSVQDKRIAKLQSKTSREGGTAGDFDVIFGHLTEGRGSFVAEALSFARNERGSFTKGAGARFVSGLVRASDQLYQFDQSQTENPAPRLVSEARTAFEEANSAHEAFVAEAEDAEWLGWVHVPGDQPPDRVALIHAAYQRISTDLVQAESTCLDLMDARASEVLAHPLDADPSPVLEYAGRYGKELAEDYLARAVVHYDDLLIKGGRLDKEALRRAIHLDKWGAYLKSATGVPTGPEAQEMKLLWLARAWYIHGKKPETLGSADPELPKLSNKSPKADWRAQFALQLAFERHDCAYPLPGASTVAYLSTSRSGAKTWVVDASASHPAGGDIWDIQRAVYSESGDTISQLNYKIERFGNAYQSGQQSLLGTRELGAEIFVASWDKLPVSELPDAFWSRRIPLDEHKSRLRRQASPCLVIHRSFGELWFSPELGLVYERKDAFTRELVYSGRSQ